MLKNGILSASEIISHMIPAVMAAVALAGTLLDHYIVPCLGDNLLLAFVICKVSETVLLKSFPVQLRTHTSLHWLPTEYNSVFKTELLLYRFLQSAYPKYFDTFLRDRHSVSNSEAKLMVCCPRVYTLPHFHTSLQSILASALHMML